MSRPQILDFTRRLCLNPNDGAERRHSQREGYPAPGGGVIWLALAFGACIGLVIGLVVGVALGIVESERDRRWKAELRRSRAAPARAVRQQALWN